MDYFKKVGRPTDEEQAVIQAIEQIIKEKQIPRSEIPVCQSLDDLLEVQNLLEAYVSDAEQHTGTESDTVEHIQDQTEPEQEPDFSNETDQGNDPEQLEEPNEDPKENEHKETETDEVEESADQIDQIIETVEPVEEPEIPKVPNYVADDYDPFGDEIKKRSYNIDNGQGKKPGESDSELPDDTLPESEETPLDELNPNTKRKLAEKTADSLLKGYAKIAPIPFKWLAKINEDKVERMHFEGEIDITLEVSEGTTFDDYMRQTNEQIDEMFEVDQDTLDEIREPLIEVLLEQKMELTPQQRLAMAVVNHLVQMFTVAISLRRQNNRILEYQKRMTMLMSGQRAA